MMNVYSRKNKNKWDTNGPNDLGFGQVIDGGMEREEGGEK
jgi:hypothetical protein